MSEISWRFSPALVEAELNAILLPLGLPLAPQNANIEYSNGANSSFSTRISVLSDTANLSGRESLRAAMRAAVFGGGKRLRSQLVLEAAGVVGGADFEVRRAFPAACALEMIHAYSLVHDDLPSMDNADTRRGRPSCHRQFGEATAILAGDALLTRAFEVLADSAFIDAQFVESSTRNAEIALRLRALKLVAQAAGESGMVGGQAIDIAWSDAHVTAVDGAELLAMHALKTGALLRVASESGALLGGGSEAQIAALRDYGAHLGRAFQIADDVLDATGDPNQTGKAASDADNDKITATGVFGLERAREMAQQAAQAALDALQIFGTEAAALRQLAHFVVEREK